MKTFFCRKTPKRPCERVARQFAGLTLIALVLAALPAHRANATPLIGGPSGTLALTVNAGPLIVDSPGRFEITGVIYVPPVYMFPGVLKPTPVTEPGDYRFSLFSEGTIDARTIYSLSLSDRSKRAVVNYTLRFELLPGACPAMAAVSNNMQLSVVSGRLLSFSVLRRPAGKPTGPQLISTPNVVCVNPQSEARLIFNPSGGNFLPLELETRNGTYSSVTELAIPL